MPSKRTTFTPSSILFRPLQRSAAIPGGLWWRRRVLPPGPKGLLRSPFIAIAGLRRHPEYKERRQAREGRARRIAAIVAAARCAANSIARVRAGSSGGILLLRSRHARHAVRFRRRLAAIPPAELFLGFAKISVSGFGMILPWARRLIVDEKQWMTAEEFNETYSLAQFLPGPNVVNMSVVFGSRMRGAAGAAVALLGLLGPAGADRDRPVGSLCRVRRRRRSCAASSPASPPPRSD